MGTRLVLLGFGVVAVAVLVGVLAVMRSNGLQFGSSSCDDTGASYAFVDGETVDGEFLSAVGRPREPVDPGDGFTVTTTDGCGERSSRRIRRVRGAPARLAVLQADGDLAVNAGLPTGLDAFVLRRAAYGDDALLDELPRRCRALPRRWQRLRLTRTAGDPGGVVLGARSPTGRSVLLQLRRDLRFAGRQRYGLPAPRRGDVVRARGVRCPYRDRRRGTRLRADRLVLPAR